MGIDLMEPAERESLTADLRSGIGERVAHALSTLDQCWRRRRFGPLPMPPPDCLTAFGDRVPAPVLSQYLTVLMHYPDFEPTPSGSDTRRALVDAVIRYGDGIEVHAVALFLRIDEHPQSAVRDAMFFLLTRDLNGAHEIKAAGSLVHCLLDSTATRSATVDNLRTWALTDSFSEIIESVWPRLDPEERARLDVDRGE